MIDRGGSPRAILRESAAVFAAALAFLIALAPAAPFTKELGVCESGAVRDVLAGNIILPHFIPGPMVHVPPLYWWMAALCVKVFGWTELALRLPALVPAALTCAIVFAWCAATIGRRAGLWAAAALLLCHFFLDAARQPRMDSMLALFVTLAAASLERALASGRSRWFVLAAIAIALGALTKGILGIALPGLVVALFLAVRWRLLELFRLDLIASFTFGLLVGAGWYVAGYRIGGDPFLQWQFGMNLWSRFIPTDVGGAGYCAHPFWYFAPQVFTGFLPWSLYLPAFAAAAWPRAGRRPPEPLVYAICWFAAIFVFFSASQGKCLVYILPAFPPIAILAGWAIAQAGDEIADADWTSRLYTAASAIVGAAAIISIAAAIAVMIFRLPSHFPLRLHPTDRRFLEIFGAIAARRSPKLILWIVMSVAGAEFIRRGIWNRIGRAQAFGVLTIAAAGSWFWFGVMNPALAESETLKTFAREAASIVPANDRIGHIGLEDCDIYFYSPRPIEPVFRFRCDAGSPQYIVTRERRFDAMAPARRECLKPVLKSAPVDSNGARVLLERTAPAD
jgi:hypothetical protein